MAGRDSPTGLVWSGAGESVLCERYSTICQVRVSHKTNARWEVVANNSSPNRSVGGWGCTGAARGMQEYSVCRSPWVRNNGIRQNWGEGDKSCSALLHRLSSLHRLIRRLALLIPQSAVVYTCRTEFRTSNLGLRSGTSVDIHVSSSQHYNVVSTSRNLVECSSVDRTCSNKLTRHISISQLTSRCTHSNLPAHFQVHTVWIWGCTLRSSSPWERGGGLQATLTTQN